MKYRCNLYGHPTIVYTDHKPLVNLSLQLYLSKSLARWLEWLNELPLQIVCKPGPLLIVADTLSRRQWYKQLNLSATNTSLANQWFRLDAPQLIIK